MENVRIQQIHSSQINWTKVYEYFRGYTHVDIADIPENYEDYVIPMRDIIRKEALIKIKYGVTDVFSEKCDGKKTDIEKIHLEKRLSFTGKMIGEAYQDAEKIILYVVSVINMEEILRSHSDMMETFFLEYWAVSVLNAIRESYYDYFEKHLVNDNQKLTYVWSPGQANFELSNQKTLFALLQPEDMGVILDKYNRMVPLKSVSGTIGIVPKESGIEMISCDYCEHARTCPGYKGKKYLEIRMETRRI